MRLAWTSHTAYNVKGIDMGVPFVTDECKKSKAVFAEISETYADLLKKGYEEMSRINLGLAEESVLFDNEALTLAEQKLAECE